MTRLLMTRLLLQFSLVAGVLALSGAATASVGRFDAGPPVGGPEGMSTARTTPSQAASPAATASQATASTPGAVRPALTLSGPKPLLLRGSHFRGHEKVRLTFRAGSVTAVRTVRATALGTFTIITPPTLAYDRCSTGLLIAAQGTTGNLATIKRPPLGCAPG